MLSAIQGGLLLSKTTRATRPLELAFDMALEHVARHFSRTAGDASFVGE